MPTHIGSSRLISSVVEDVLVPSGKCNAAYVYCQLHVLGKLGRHKAVKQVIEDGEQWPETIMRDLDVIKELMKEIGSYDKVREIFRRMGRYIKDNPRSDPFKYPDYPKARMYFDLNEALGWWLGGEYRSRIVDPESFRGFVRDGVTLSNDDRSLFEQALPKLNKYLAANGSITLGYNRIF